ncbi:MAG: hypothetical protein NC086_02685, partial [Alistipes sp.]|nr:hypothetical protein [Alistipes sp.]
MKKQYVLFICCIMAVVAGCTSEKQQISNEVTEDIIQQEMTSTDTYVKIMEEEQKELSQYQGIKDAAELNAFYNLDSEEETSALSRSMAQAFPSTGNFRYFYTEDGVIFLGVVA